MTRPHVSGSFDQEAPPLQSRTYGSRWRRNGNHTAPPSTSSSASSPTPTSTSSGAFGIRPEPATAILRRYGGQTRRARWRGGMQRSPRVV